MDYYFGFNTPAERKKRRQAQLYDISSTVSQFFWEDAPNKYGFEEREGQQDMAFEILDAIKDDRHIAVEAGVGIGKSFAYLVPLLLYNQKSRNPIVIATSTIALQEQLLGDVERLKELLGVNPRVILAKGQNHYLCLKKFNEYITNNKNTEMKAQLETSIKDGCQDRRSFPYSIPTSIWDKINITRFSKRGCFLCPHQDNCQYYSLRIDLRYTEGIILCNQDFLTAHLFRLQREQEGLLNPRVRFVVVDEAHNLEDKVRSATTERFGQSYIVGTINAAQNSVRDEAKEYVRKEATNTINIIKALYQNLNRQIQRQIENSKQDMKYADRFFFKDEDRAVELIRQTASSLDSLSGSVQVYGSMDDWSNRKKRDTSASDELENIAQSFVDFSAKFDDELVWLEKTGNYAELVFCPKNTKDIINRLYFKGSVNTILTSATLTNTAHGSIEDQYSYFIQNTGFPVDGSGVLSEPKPSPFPYDEHAMIYYCDDLPHPTKEHEAFIEKGVERLIEVLNITNGKALVLFTAKTDMEEVHTALQARNLPYKILIQQAGSSQDRVLQEFRDDTDSVLLGTGSFWEGINIEGKSLSNLVVFRLPFPVPDPIIEYKASIANDALMEVRVPVLVIELKQGIGRLIRNFTDFGIVSIIDSRLRDNPAERYHDTVWDSLPIHNRTTDLNEAKNFYDRLNLRQ